MIIDQVQGEPVPRYLIYDIVTFEVSGGWPVRRLTTYKLVINVALNLESHNLGAVSIRKTVLPGMAIPMLKIRRPNGRLIFNMEIAIRR